MSSKNSPSPEKSSQVLSYSTLQPSSRLSSKQVGSLPSPKQASDTSHLLQPPPTLRTQSAKTPGDPATALKEAETLQRAFIDTLPFRSADTRLIQQWLSNWFGHHADCPQLDKPHLASLNKVTWNGKTLRSYSKEMLFVDLVGWGFLEGDATSLVEDIDEARGYWNRICRIMKERFRNWFTGQCIFLGLQLLRAWWDRPFTTELSVILIQQWLFISILLQLLYLNMDLLSNYFMRWEFWRLQKRHINETHV